MREYIFCSVIESPQIASRSPFFSRRLLVGGALRGWNLSKKGSIGLLSRSTANAERQRKRKSSTYLKCMRSMVRRAGGGVKRRKAGGEAAARREGCTRLRPGRAHSDFRKGLRFGSSGGAACV